MKFAKIMFSQVSVCPQGAEVSATHPPRKTSPLSRHPPGQTLPLGRHSLGRHPPSPMPSTYWDTVNKRAVGIPLECILVQV